MNKANKVVKLTVFPSLLLCLIAQTGSSKTAIYNDVMSIENNRMDIDEKTADDLKKSGELNEIQEFLWGEYDKTRELKTKSIEEFNKVLWATNSGAATVTIGFITSSENPTLLQLVGSSIFVLGILSLVAMKFVGEYNAVRDSERRFAVSGEFFYNKANMSIFKKIRDKKFNVLTWFYRKFKLLAAICFITGCIVTLTGLYPLVEKTHNKSLQPTAEASAE